MAAPDDLKAGDNQFKVKFSFPEVYVSPNLDKNLLNDLKLLFQADRPAFLIKEKPHDVSQFDDEHLLQSALYKNVLQKELEELLIFTKVVDQREFVLEMAPYCVLLSATALLRGHANAVAQLLIVGFRGD